MFTPRAHQLEPTFFRISTLSNFFMNLYFWRRLNPMMRRSETLRAAETQIPQSACPTSSYRPRAARPAGARTVHAVFLRDHIQFRGSPLRSVCACSKPSGDHRNNKRSVSAASEVPQKQGNRLDVHQLYLLIVNL